MLTKKTIGFLGAGNLAEALIKGLLASKIVTAGQIIAGDRISERLVHMAETYEIKVYNKNSEVAENSDILFITVKPNDVPGVVRAIASALRGDKLIITAAAGVTTKTVLENLKEGGHTGFIPVVRAMPNTPVIVSEGAIGICAGLGATEADLKLARTVFEAVGRVLVVDDEGLLDAVTGLSGSGPAYVFLFMQALADAGARAGLDKKTSLALALQTTLGAAKLALESDKNLDELIKMVSSPGGTTVEGLKRLRDGGLKGTVEKAVLAATARAKELSGSGG
ncbi:MAG: pyrroline-5-carboxylate reductase [Deltaproteobacteria bacterium]|nr:pyrroline-5-carboxylate reductase [Deltaproteobacteria bacterium]